jgi:hypothetical protein
MTIHPAAVAGLFLACACAPSAWALEVGQALPPIGAATWLAGKPPAPGTVVVVDLWAPEDPAARATMPCLTDLQHHYGDRIQVVGLTAAAPDAADAFIARMGARIDYRLAAVPALTAWLPDGIPAPITLLVDNHGTVVWWGDATELARPLAQVMDGTFVPPPAPLPAPILVAAPPVAAPAAPAAVAPAPAPAPEAPAPAAKPETPKANPQYQM